MRDAVGADAGSAMQRTRTKKSSLDGCLDLVPWGGDMEEFDCYINDYTCRLFLLVKTVGRMEASLSRTKEYIHLIGPRSVHVSQCCERKSRLSLMKIVKFDVTI